MGLSHKLRACTLQDEGLDTVDANLSQCLPVGSREYGTAAQILGELGVRSIRSRAAAGTRPCSRSPCSPDSQLDL